MNTAENLISSLMAKIMEETGQPMVPISLARVQDKLRKKKILITGANGYIGEACFNWLNTNTRADVSGIDREVNRRASSIIPIDIRHVQDLRSYLEIQKPEVIIHSAAYKYVPEMEVDPWQGLETNILGTAQMIDLAGQNGCQHFLYISTDKAVYPRSLLGMSKRWGELYALMQGVKYIPVVQVLRFGNVLNSTGSVLPIFQHQYHEKGAVEVTDSQMSRYFTNIQQVISSIVTLLTLDHSGIFVPDMGKSISLLRIVDLFEGILGVPIPRKIVGVRPGEKLQEDLWYSIENSSKLEEYPIWKTVGIASDMNIVQLTSELLPCIQERNFSRLNELFSTTLV